MYNLILATEKYSYFCNEDEHVKMCDKDNVIITEGNRAIEKMLFELELIMDGTLKCKFKDDYMLGKFIAEYW